MHRAKRRSQQFADDIAWHTHDIDDGLRAELLTRNDLREVDLVREITDQLPSAQTGTLDQGREIYEITRRLISRIIADAVCEARIRLEKLRPDHPDAIRGSDTQTISFSASMQSQLDELRPLLVRPSLSSSAR